LLTLLQKSDYDDDDDDDAVVKVTTAKGARLVTMATLRLDRALSVHVMSRKLSIPRVTWTATASCSVPTAVRATWAGCAISE